MSQSGAQLSGLGAALGMVVACLEGAISRESEQKSELHLLDKVIVVPALVLRFGHPG
jgi:hypothetical protein